MGDWWGRLLLLVWGSLGETWGAPVGLGGLMPGLGGDLGESVFWGALGGVLTPGWGGGGAFLVVWAYLGLTWRGGLNPGLGGSLGVWGHRGGSPGFWESLRSLGGLWVPMEPSLPPLVPPQVRGGADLGRGGRCAGG